jgi:hypothetical protein
LNWGSRKGQACLLLKHEHVPGLRNTGLCDRGILKNIFLTVAFKAEALFMRPWQN